ncbi:S-layer homology domain-containing protein [candidate division KSB1 bacterium]
MLTIALMTLVYFGEQTGIWFKASVLEVPQAFNGTVMPVSKVPHWSHWHTQNNLTYEQIPESKLIDLPAYDLSKMQFPDDKLIWNDSSQDDIRNVKITYAVVYLGNYKYDHKENAGSHLGIDMKLPVGTPIHAIANGKVTKISTQSSGFGHHVVIKHPNVPDPEKPGLKTTLYSAYNHMDRVDVKEGQNVLKGQIIGTSGNTGTSTTPHLHFQIDRDSAPWHPYWPFSWQESQDAGLSFFEAVNGGLGINNAKNNTVHPMDFITKNINHSTVATTDNTTPENVGDETQDDPEPEPQPEPQPEPEVIENPFTDTGKSALFEYKITGESVSLLGNGITLIVTDEGSQVSQLSDDDVINVELNGVGRLVKKQFKKSDFKSNTIKVTVSSSEKGTANVTIGKSSYQVNFIDKVENIAKFHIEHDGHYQKSVVETVKIIALDENDNVTPAVNFSGVVNITALDDKPARIIPEQLEARDFVNGIADIKVIIGHDQPIRFRAQNGALVGTSESLHTEDKNLFTDINIYDSNYDAIKYLKDKDIIAGYPDGSFKPSNTVNRAEALKMLMLAFNVDVGGPYEINYSDVDKEAWYAPTLATASARGIVKGYDDGKFRPGNTVNRAEYLKILFETTGTKPNSEITKPYDDVDINSWFAGYAFLANKMNLLNPADKLNPANGMTRAGVAKTIYRMKMIQENNLVSYSK